MTFEIQILDQIQNIFRCPLLDTVMPFITALADKGIFWIVLALILTLNKKTRPLGITVILSMILELVCCNLILKPLVARTRPFEINTAVELLIEKPLDYSFPSGHTGCSFAVTSALFFSRSRLWAPACVLSVLIAFSRLYLYVHFPTDVLGGLVLGLACGWAAARLLKLKSVHG